MKKANLNFKHFLISTLLFWIELRVFSFFIDNKFPSDKDNVRNSISINEEIKEEYNIWGIRCIRLYEPLYTYILFIVLSVKKNALIVIYKENDNKNNINLRDNIL